MGWYIPQGHLSQTQLSVVEAVTRQIDTANHFICGFAGSGKSVVLTHVLERLIADRQTARFAFLSYTHALVGMAREALAGSGLREAHLNCIQFSTVHGFMYGNHSADIVFVDEAQDLQQDWLDKIRGRARRVVLAGDYEQTIYGEAANRTEMQNCFAPVVHELREVFRLTPSLKEVALAINPSARNVVEAEAVNTTDAQIRDVVFDKIEDEVAWVANEAQQRARAGKPSAVLFHHHRDLRAFYETLFRTKAIELPTDHPGNLTERYIGMNDSMAAAGVPLSYYGNRVGTLRHGERGAHVYLMTMHSAKGLDFKNVFLPTLRREPTKAVPHLEPFQDRVCYVGVTRTFENLFLSHLEGPMEAPFNRLPQGVVTTIAPGRPTAAAEDIFF
ncbi:DUF2075 domain-containing protein [Rhodobacter sp. KR11]|uniref:DNA/RNA helicase domain-containing protein n=1 Tax=Rhodobacter sp. KR11 TaxID=2974588 RepID=UPI002221EDC6|nr:DNA/RNA helicase domain-containing protein [Rhodobacter sp. KR11]MCW1919225.1 DUF2075 domain-containing protein [Rhodobacter sp. KR11]